MSRASRKYPRHQEEDNEFGEIRLKYNKGSAQTSRSVKTSKKTCGGRTETFTITKKKKPKTLWKHLGIQRETATLICYKGSV